MNRVLENDALSISLGELARSQPVCFVSPDAVSAFGRATKHGSDMVLPHINLPGSGGFNVALTLQKFMQEFAMPMLRTTVSKRADLKQRAKEMSVFVLSEKSYDAFLLADAIETDLSSDFLFDTEVSPVESVG